MTQYTRNVNNIKGNLKLKIVKTEENNQVDEKNNNWIDSRFLSHVGASLLVCPVGTTPQFRRRY